MIKFKVKFKKVLNDYPDVAEEFLSYLRNSNSLYKNTDIDDIKWYYDWNFHEENENDLELEPYRFEMRYKDRLYYELSKVRINVIMKAGKFKISDRVNSSKIPKKIIKSIDDIVKAMMFEEQKFFQNKDILDSIPMLDYTIYNEDVDINYSYNFPKDEHHYSESYDIDDILDKIGEYGIESLSRGEREFLDNQNFDK